MLNNCNHNKIPNFLILSLKECLKNDLSDKEIL